MSRDIVTRASWLCYCIVSVLLTCTTAASAAGVTLAAVFVLTYLMFSYDSKQEKLPTLTITFEIRSNSTISY